MEPEGSEDGHGGNPAASAAAASAAADAAVALLERAMQDSLRPVVELGGALRRMARTLTTLERCRALTPGGPWPIDVQRWPETLRAELAICIESLQFHDRLMQQLGQVRELLRPGAAGAALPRPLAPPHAGTVELFDESVADDPRGPE